MAERTRLDRIAALIRESQQARQDWREAQEGAEEQMRRVEVVTRTPAPDEPKPDRALDQARARTSRQ